MNSLTIICILKGASKFAADLFEQLELAAFAKGRNMTFHMDFIVANTYVVKFYGCYIEQSVE